MNKSAPDSVPDFLGGHTDPKTLPAPVIAATPREMLGYVATAYLAGVQVGVLGSAAEVEQLRTNNKDLEQIFDLQWTRMQQATALWRAESPADRASVMPDLGDLLKWLIERGNSEVPEPCQPIGCDNGYHLPGCAFAEVDAEEGGPIHA